ncbi:GGDEF domain-containing protein [Lentibacillus cibarius]|uniref:GGDEF domain-containing protein n=1 Tax=Lentibacillus cibarius TaxID=2583219 RepID=A0A5S3QLD3_9BACI|nr:GGDEF domain-containing protein [Lentibacillus cibarius]TMN22670.1 GGDEF domain-containing protein [Lentibacillus cibarius]
MKELVPGGKNDCNFSTTCNDFHTCYRRFFLYVDYFFYNNDFIRATGIVAIQLAGISVSSYWIAKIVTVLKKNKDKDRFFRLLLGIGVIPYSIAVLHWAYHYLYVETSLPYPGFSDYLWLLAYFIWVIALTYKLVLVIQKTEITHVDRSFFTFLSIGFSLQILADFVYLQQILEGAYTYSGWIDPLWTVTLLLKGAAGIYHLQVQKLGVAPRGHWFIDWRKDNTSYLLLAIFLSYVLVRSFGTMNLLLTSLYIVFILVIIKQVALLKQNNQTVEQLNRLSKSLEEKVENKTKQLQYALDEVSRMAKYDNLTGLPNRHMLHGRLNEITHSEIEAALMFIDLDRFKLINDTMGHEAGDKLLVEVAKRLEKSIRKNDIVARLGGDEFIILLEDIHPDDVAEIAQRILMSLLPRL